MISDRHQNFRANSRQGEARDKQLTTEADPVWNAVIAAEDEHGEGAEAHARREAERLAATGDEVQAAIWRAAADDLHILHTINRQRARRRSNRNEQPNVK